MWWPPVTSHHGFPARNQISTGNRKWCIVCGLMSYFVIVLLTIHERPAISMTTSAHIFICQTHLFLLYPGTNITPTSFYICNINVQKLINTCHISLNLLNATTRNSLHDSSTLRPEQIGRMIRDILKCIFLNWNHHIISRYSMRFFLVVSFTIPWIGWWFRAVRP